MKGRWAGQVRQWWMQQKHLNFLRACDLKTPPTLEPILPAVCVTKTFSASFVSSQWKATLMHSTKLTSVFTKWNIKSIQTAT